jgi:hypothetical protein
VPHSLYDKIEAENPDALRLFMRLKRVHWHRDRFALANALGREWHWGWSRLREATKALVRLGIMACIHEGGHGPKDPPIYVWCNPLRSPDSDQ